VNNPVLENGVADTAPGLIVGPQNKTNGYIQGFYPDFTVQAGDRFQASVGCAYGSPCYVTYRLDYRINGGAINILWTWKEANDGKIYNVNYDLSALAGKKVSFILTLLATGSASGDRVVWGQPRIVREGYVPPPTATPLYSNWLTYTNTKWGYRFQYPPGSFINTDDGDSLWLYLPIQSGTDLSSKFLITGASDTGNGCQGYLDPSSSIHPETVVINGQTFLKWSTTDQNMNSLYKTTHYAVERGTVCLELGFTLRSGLAYDPPPPHYDEAAESAVFEQILSTFNWFDSSATPTATTVIPTPTWTPTPTTTPTLTALEAQVLARANQVVQLIKNKGFGTLATYVHPDSGVRFSPYATVRTSDLVFTPTQVNGLWTDTHFYHWGYYDGSGYSIDMVFPDYYALFVYDQDFANAPEIAVNQTLGIGTVPDNARDFYTGSTVVEYHFSGFDPQYEGMDWKSLRLAFTQKDGVWYLVGIIHAQWTI
jgi:hypothetical protein